MRRLCRSSVVGAQAQNPPAMTAKFFCANTPAVVYTRNAGFINTQGVSVMRELSMQEIGMVGGGGDEGPPETMGMGCFSAMIFIGISPLLGISGMIGAAFNAFSSCEGVDFTS
tara:strand:- start:34054 stop:34392 length:339 start_codon:yes stop_codon:yes gene_type:complete